MLNKRPNNKQRKVVYHKTDTVKSILYFLPKPFKNPISFFPLYE